MQQHFSAVRIMPVLKKEYEQKKVTVAVMRLDEGHPVISGNKWFKLKAYLQEAAQQRKKAILTFGGAYSNHLIATAAACPLYGFTSIGIVRGESPKTLSPTLSDAQQYGMQLFFSSRDDYQNKKIPDAVYELFKKCDLYVINEGGYGEKGAEGCMDILKSSATHIYTHIIAAVGTGTMLSGLINAAEAHQQVIGISVLKNHFSVEQAVQTLVKPSVKTFRILHDFHFGGYAKKTGLLIQFMNDWYAQTGIPTDFVYTAKTFFAADQLLKEDYFEPGSSLLLIQSGGLQGNRSLPKGLLLY